MWLKKKSGFKGFCPKKRTSGATTRNKSWLLFAKKCHKTLDIYQVM